MFVAGCICVTFHVLQQPIEDTNVRTYIDAFWYEDMYMVLHMRLSHRLDLNFPHVTNQYLEQI